MRRKILAEKTNQKGCVIVAKNEKIKEKILLLEPIVLSVCFGIPVLFLFFIPFITTNKSVIIGFICLVFLLLIINTIICIKLEQKVNRFTK